MSDKYKSKHILMFLRMNSKDRFPLYMNPLFSGKALSFSFLLLDVRGIDICSSYIDFKLWFQLALARVLHAADCFG